MANMATLEHHHPVLLLIESIYISFKNFIVSTSSKGTVLYLSCCIMCYIIKNIYQSWSWKPSFTYLDCVISVDHDYTIQYLTIKKGAKHCFDIFLCLDVTQSWRFQPKIHKFININIVLVYKNIYNRERIYL